MPLLLARSALAEMAAGQRLLVRTTDPGAERDLSVFAEQCGHGLEVLSRRGGVLTCLLRKAGQPAD